MKTTVFRFIAVCMSFGLLTACSGGSSSQKQAAPDPVKSAEPESTAAEVQPSEEATPAVPAYSMDFDPKAYVNPDDDRLLNALMYATNHSDRPVEMTVRCQAFDTEGNIISAFSLSKGEYVDEQTMKLYIPAEADHRPVAAALLPGYRYDMSTGQQMPEIDHLEFELLETKDSEWGEISEHFTPGEPEIRDGHIYVNVGFDQDVEEKYTSVYADYTILGYTGDAVTAVICSRNYPYGASSLSVEYAKESNNNALLIYHDIPNDPVDRWEIYMGCISGE